MQYQIDQSGKIEDTSRLTIVAFADGKAKSLKISAVEKQKLIKIMRELDYPRNIFIFKIFAGLIYLLLIKEKWNSGDSLLIDREYPGHEGIIKDILSNLFRKMFSQLPVIEFGEIGKKSSAHLKAIAVFRGKANPNMTVKADDVLNILYQQKNRWSARSRRENP